MPTRAIAIASVLALLGCSIEGRRATELSAQQETEAFAVADSLNRVAGPADAGTYLRLRARSTRSARLAFGAARYLMRADSQQAAITAVQRAAEFGYARPIFLTDPGFDPLRSDPRWIRATRRVEQNYLARGVDAEIYRLYQADQAHRLASRLSMAEIESADVPRIRRVREILRSRRPSHPDDLLHAAMVLHHSHDPTDNDVAALLADSARRTTPPHPLAAWLSAAARDRSLQRRGLPQWFGTQTSIRDGVAVLDPATVDTTAVSPEERRARNAPAIDELRALMARHDSLVAARRP